MESLGRKDELETGGKYQGLEATNPGLGFPCFSSSGVWDSTQRVHLSGCRFLDWFRPEYQRDPTSGAEEEPKNSSSKQKPNRNSTIIQDDSKG